MHCHHLGQCRLASDREIKKLAEQATAQGKVFRPVVYNFNADGSLNPDRLQDRRRLSV